jgi:transposase-like protein
MAGADRMAVEDVVRKVLVDEHADVLREPLRWSVARLMEVEVCEVIGAEHGQRTPDRAAHRNGYRAREWQTRAGTVERTNPSTAELVHEPRSLLLRRAQRSPSRTDSPRRAARAGRRPETPPRSAARLRLSA